MPLASRSVFSVLKLRKEWRVEFLDIFPCTYALLSSSPPGEVQIERSFALSVSHASRPPARLPPNVQ